MTIDERHYSRVAALLADGEVIPFPGAGANLCDRPEEAPWEAGRFPPSGRELVEVLSYRSHYPEPDDADLSRISQYVDAILGEGQRYRYLHEVFNADYPPTSLHRLLARLPGSATRARSAPIRRADDELGRPRRASARRRRRAVDVVWYEAKRGPFHGCFMHRSPHDEVVPIEKPNQYTGIDPAVRPVILKLHGAIDRGDRKRDSYVVTRARAPHDRQPDQRHAHGLGGRTGE